MNMQTEETPIQGNLMGSAPKMETPPKYVNINQIDNGFLITKQKPNHWGTSQMVAKTIEEVNQIVNEYFA